MCRVKNKTPQLIAYSIQREYLLNYCTADPQIHVLLHVTMLVIQRKKIK